MTKEDLNQKLQELEKEYKKKKNDLLLEYLKANTHYKNGDILKDTQTNVIIVVEKITGHIPFMGSYPEPVYKGSVMTKKLIKHKGNKIEAIFGEKNVILLGHID